MIYAGDNDPARFWRHTLGALDRARPGVADRMGPLLGLPAPAPFELLVTALINELAVPSDDRELLLVLDDYHMIGAQAGARLGSTSCWTTGRTTFS